LPIIALMRLVMKPGGFFDHHHFLAHPLPYFDRGGQRVVVRLQSPHHLEQFHLVHGIEEVHAHTLLRAVGHAGNFRDTQRRSVRRQNCRGSADLVEQSEDLNLRLHLFRDSFNHQIGLARGLFHRARIFQPVEGCIGIRRRNFPSSTALSRLARISLSARRSAAGTKSSRTVR
jgi:hypothetical protein